MTRPLVRTPKEQPLKGCSVEVLWTWVFLLSVLWVVLPKKDVTGNACRTPYVAFSVLHQVSEKAVTRMQELMYEGEIVINSLVWVLCLAGTIAVAIKIFLQRRLHVCR